MPTPATRTRHYLISGLELRLYPNPIEALAMVKVARPGQRLFAEY